MHLGVHSAQGPVDTWVLTAGVCGALCAWVHAGLGAHAWGLCAGCLPALPGWALTPNCEQMCLTGPGRGSQLFGCLKTASSGGPEGSLEHLDPAEEHLTLGAAAGQDACLSQPVLLHSVWGRQGHQAVYQVL